MQNTRNGVAFKLLIGNNIVIIILLVINIKVLLDFECNEENLIGLTKEFFLTLFKAMQVLQKL